MLKTPTKVVSILPREKKGVRTELKVLDAYVDQIRLWSSMPGQTSSVCFQNNVEIDISPWAARAVGRFCDSPHPTRGEVEDLVTQGIAVMAKCRTDLLKNVGPGGNKTQVYANQAEMMLDVAVGTVVVHEIQKKGNALLSQGENEAVRELNQFQHTVRHVVQDVRKMLGDAERRQANEFAEAFEEEVSATSSAAPGTQSAAPETQHRAGTADVEVVSPSTPAEDRRKSGPRTPPPKPQAPGPALPKERRKPSVFTIEAPHPPNSRGYLIPLAVFAILIGFGVYGLVKSASSPEIKGDASDSLSAALTASPGVTEIQDRMPYVILTVHADFWADASPSKRESWILDLSKPVTRHGYSGLVVRSSSGIPLAEWVEDRGVKFSEHPTE